MEIRHQQGSNTNKSGVLLHPTADYANFIGVDRAKLFLISSLSGNTPIVAMSAGHLSHKALPTRPSLRLIFYCTQKLYDFWRCDMLVVGR